MRRVTFATLASLMFIAFLGTLPLTSLAEEGKWTKKADMPTARSYFSTSMVNGKIYAIGGTNLPPATIPAPIALTVEEYDPATDTWTKKSDMPTARSALSTSVVNGKIYVIGGYGTGWTPLRTVEEYDPVTDTWTKKSDMPTARGFLAASVVNGKIYAIGGYEGFILSTSTLSTVEEYDPVTDTWTKKSNMPAVRGFLAASVVNGKIYTIGGDTSHNGPALSTVEEYDPATDTWTKKSDMPTARVVLSRGRYIS
ncbi:hypothetical protein HYR99_16695 [Candidatus Poribacteria bacterium]|nr:hypothetical protein [Candidatus Poribacteria bacterium]